MRMRSNLPGDLPASWNVGDIALLIRHDRAAATEHNGSGSLSSGRKLPRRLPAQYLDAHDGQHGERNDHQDLTEVVDPGYERQPEQEERGHRGVHRDRMVAQVRC